MMSASARKLDPRKLILVVSVAITLLAVVPAATADAQSGSVPAAQVAEIVARIRASAANEVESPGALALGQALLVEQRYAEA